MRPKQAKRIKKILQFYNTHFYTSVPYNVLADGTFCRAAQKSGIDLSSQLSSYFSCETSLVTTTCAIDECKQLGPLMKKTYKMLQKLTVVSCTHDPEINAGHCFASLVRSECPYIIASQDRELQAYIQKQAGIPHIFISGTSLHLEDPSEQSREKAEKMDRDKQMNCDKMVTLKKLKQAQNIEDIDNTQATPGGEKKTSKKRKHPQNLEESNGNDAESMPGVKKKLHKKRKKSENCDSSGDDKTTKPPCVKKKKKHKKRTAD